MKAEASDWTDGRFRITNRYDFLSLDDAGFLAGRSRPTDASSQRGNCRRSASRPGRRVRSACRCRRWPATPSTSSRSALAQQGRRPLVPKGFEIAWDQLRRAAVAAVGRVAPEIAPHLRSPSTTRLPWPSCAGRTHRGLRQAGGHDALARLQGHRADPVGPVPDLWRVPTDNDLGNKMPERLGMWRDAGPRRTISSVYGRAGVEHRGRRDGRVRARGRGVAAHDALHGSSARATSWSTCRSCRAGPTCPNCRDSGCG